MVYQNNVHWTHHHFRIEYNGDKIIWRPAIPILLDSPVPFVSEFPAPAFASDIDFDNHSGLGDIGFDLAYAHTTESGILVAGGLFTTLPTASSRFRPVRSKCARVSRRR